MDASQIREVMKLPKNPSGVVDSGTSAAPTIPTIMNQFQYDQQNTPGGQGTNTLSPGISPDQGVNVDKFCIKQTFKLAGQSSLAFTQVIPPYSRITEAALTFDTPVVLATATNLGVSAGLTTLAAQLILSSTTVTKNTQTVNFPAAAAPSDNSGSSSGLTVYLTPTNTTGTLAGTMVSGTVRAYLIGTHMDPPFKAP